MNSSLNMGPGRGSFCNGTGRAAIGGMIATGGMKILIGNTITKRAYSKEQALFV